MMHEREQPKASDKNKHTLQSLEERIVRTPPERCVVMTVLCKEGFSHPHSITASTLSAGGDVTRIPSSSRFPFFAWESECLSDSFTISRVGLREVLKLSFDDELWHALHRHRDVAK